MALTKVSKLIVFKDDCLKPAAGAICSVRNAETGSLIQMRSGRDENSPLLNNPYTTADGNLEFYASYGRINIDVSHYAGNYTLSDVIVVNEEAVFSNESGSRVILFDDIVSVTAGISSNGNNIDYSALILQGGSVILKTAINNVVSGRGGAEYTLKTLAQAAIDGDVIDGTGDPNYKGGNHLCSDGVHCAILNVEGKVSSYAFGVIADGSTDDLAAMQLAIDFAVDMLVEGNISISDKIVFNRDNINYDFNGTILYSGPESSSLLEISGDNITMNNPTFSGANKQVKAGLAYIADNTKKLTINGLTIRDIKGILQGPPSVTRNSQNGLIISPWGVECTLNNPKFINITNDNSGTYDTATIGYGFCSGIVFARDDLQTIGDNSENASIVTCKSAQFINIQTIRATGLSTNDATDFNDGDAIRVIGNTASTTIDATFYDSIFIDVSKRAVKASTASGLNFFGVKIYDKTLPYRMIHGVRCSSQGVVCDVEIQCPEARPISVAAVIEKASGVTLKRMSVDHCATVLNFNPDTNIKNEMNDISLSSIKCDHAYSGGVTISSTPSKIVNYTAKDIEINCEGDGIMGYEQINDSEASCDAVLENIKIYNGDVNLRGLNIRCSNVTQIIDNPDYVGSNSLRPIMSLGNSQSYEGDYRSSYDRISCIINDCDDSITTSGREALLQYSGNSSIISGLEFTLKESVNSLIPVADFYGDDVELENSNFNTIGFIGIARTAISNNFKGSNLTRRGGANARQFLVITKEINMVLTDITDYSETTNVCVQETTGATGQSCIVNGVYSNTSGPVAAVVANGTLANSYKF